jgi:hypothetical protein
MKAPSDSARLVLDRYVAATAPAGANKVRLLDVIQQRAIRGDLPRFDVQTMPPTVLKASFVQRLWAWPLGKSGLAFAAVGLPALGVYAAHEARPTGTAQRAALSASFREAVVAPTLPVASDVAPQTASDQGLPTVASTLPRARAEKSNDAAVASETTVDEEVKLMNDAQAALRSDNPSHALQLLNEDARRFPNGKLASARAVAHMIALCRLGRADEVRLEADRFLAKTPNSPFAGRVGDVCSSLRENR